MSNSSYTFVHNMSQTLIKDPYSIQCVSLTRALLATFHIFLKQNNNSALGSHL